MLLQISSFLFFLEHKNVEFLFITKKRKYTNKTYPYGNKNENFFFFQEWQNIFLSCFFSPFYIIIMINAKLL